MPAVLKADLLAEWMVAVKVAAKADEMEERKADWMAYEKVLVKDVARAAMWV